MNPADLRKLQESAVVKEAIKILGRAAEQKIPTRNEFTTVRDYLLVTALYENGSRPGPLENAKVRRFKQAQRTKNGRWVVLVDEHKTSRHYGPAELVFDDRLYGYMKIFVNCIRPCYAPKNDEDAIFIKDYRNQFTKGTIGRRVKEFFKRAGIRSDISVGATKICQIHSNEASEMSPKKRKAIASHMKHQTTTADANYVLKVNAEKAGRAHELMSKIIEEKADTEDEKTKAEVADWDDPKEVRKEGTKEKEEENSNQESEKEDDHVEEKEDNSSRESKEEDQVHLTNAVSTEEKSVLMTVFQETILKGRVLTISEVRSQMKSVPYMRRFVLDQSKTKFYDFVRHRTNVVRQTTDICHEDDEFEFVTSLPSSQRKAWEAHDTKNIDKGFSAFNTVPNTKDVIAHFQRDSVLKHILEREGPNSCYEKVKSMFKRRPEKCPASKGASSISINFITQ